MLRGCSLFGSVRVHCGDCVLMGQECVGKGPREKVQRGWKEEVW